VRDKAVIKLLRGICDQLDGAEHLPSEIVSELGALFSVTEMAVSQKRQTP